MATYTYDLMPWGDFIKGTRAALEDLGLVFPPEAARRRVWKCVDPRGFPCTVQQERGGEFIARIKLPGREEVWRTKRPYAPGVVQDTGVLWADQFEGTADALIAAGLVKASDLPGAPGRMKSVTYFGPAGEPLPGRWGHYGDVAGARVIRRRGRDCYVVSVVVANDECERRGAAERAAREAYKARMATLPRPAPLVSPKRKAMALDRRAKIHLAYSRPQWVPTIVVQP